MGKFSKPRNREYLPREPECTPPLPEDQEPELTPAYPVAEASADAPTIVLPVLPQEPVEDEEILPPKAPDPWQKNREKAAKSKRTSMILIALCGVAAALLLITILCLWLIPGTAKDDGLILQNVTVAGINLGGMTKEEAAAALHQATDDTYTTTDMVVELPDTILTFSPADTGAQLDVEAAVDAAYAYGREGTREELAQIQNSASTTVHHIGLLPYLNLDVTYIRAQLDDYGSSFNSSFTQSTVEVTGEAPLLDAGKDDFDPDAPCQVLVLYLGTPGRKLDIDSLYNQVLDAYSFNQFLVVSQMEEEEALPDPLDLEALYQQYASDPVDAVMDPETFEVTREIYGYGFDLEVAQLMLEASQYGDTLHIDMEMTAPAVLGDTLSDVLFRDVLASYETAHTKNENRNTNLRLACAAINGLVLEPGDVFDYNKVVGKRTEEAGYKKADAYSSGQTVQTLGGGICQVSSTLYYCTLVADLEIVTRSPHSYVSSYMPMGMDATVSWGGPEFRFKNNTNYPIRIEAEVSDGYVKVKLIGTDEKDYYIKMEYEVLATQSPTTIYEEYAPDNEEGYKDGQVITTAYKGYTVQTYKLKYDKETDELIVKEKDQVSTYKKRDKVICKIVEETKPTEAPTEPPATTPTETNPPETQPPVTEPPATEPPATSPPATEPPATSPPEAPASGETTA